MTIRYLAALFAFSYFANSSAGEVAEPSPLTLSQPTSTSATSSSTMAIIPSGQYIPLYTTDKTPRVVRSFQLDITSVTKRQFLAFVLKHPKWQRSNVSPIFADQTYLKDWKGNTDPGPDLDSPVTYISWFAANAYAKHLGKRLPTVDEWEFVALADSTRPDASSEESYTQTILQWYSQRPLATLPSPHTFKKNFYGVKALHGLIWEWNSDFNNAMVTGESRGDTGIERNLFCAGGALSATDVRNYAAFMRYAFRSSLKGSYTTANLGFRCAKNLSATK